MDRELVIRADATPVIGIGHVMRCIALAQAWREEAETVTFLSCCESAELRQEIEGEGFNFFPVEKSQLDPDDLAQTLACLAHRKPAWMALDGYNFDPGYQKAIREAGHRLLVIDDYNHQPCYHADILLNQNINSERIQYSCNSDARFLLGTQYAMLRKEFSALANMKREIPPVARRVMVTLGGAAPGDLMLKVIQALNLTKISGLEAKILVGVANPHVGTLTEEIRKTRMDERGVPFLRILRNADMPALMAWADLAVSAGGSTCWELAFMGVPMITVIMADNQEGIAIGLDEHGAARNLGWADVVTVEEMAFAVPELCYHYALRAKMSSAGRKLVDGKGARRVVRMMKEMKP